MESPPYKEGDVFLLFQKLPYDFCSGELPLKILENLYFDNTPSELLSPESFCRPHDVRCLLEYAGLVNYVLPGHTLPGIGITHCCLRYDRAKANPYPNFDHSFLFSVFITALRLQKPCPIAVGGKFTFGSAEEPIQSPEIWLLQTSSNPKFGLSFSKADILLSADIAKDLLKILGYNNKNRIKSALIYFSQVTQGFSVSLQLSYLGLWASLEALFKPNNNKAETLAKRITDYLSPFSSIFPNMETWLKEEYINRRSEFTHGSHISPDRLQNATGSEPAFHKLHEVARLCLLGFLSLEESQRTQIVQQKNKQLQLALKKLGPAKGKYLNQQKMYLSTT